MKMIFDNTDNYSLDLLISLCTKDRVERSLSYRIENRRKLYLLGELLLQKVLTSLKLDYTGLLYTENGKPYLNIDNFYFNISHADNKIVLVYDEKPVGVDIELIKERDLSIIDKFHPYEVEFINKSKSKLEDFYKVWTLKESYLKAIGTGLFKDLNSFYVLPTTLIESNVKANFAISKRDRYIVSTAILFE